jgi:hypothetical protein
MVLVGLLTAAWASVAIPARATYGARTTADEPQYLLTARSIAVDGDLDISDEIADRSFEPYHEIDIDPQTQVRDDGREISPHDPLLPLVLAPAMALPGEVGWVAAKATLAALGGLLAALLVWIAVRRLDVPVGTATIVVGCFTLTAPLTSYGTQVYPELPAALATAAGIALVTGSRRAGPLAGLVLAVTALPWLGVKYVPVAGALALVGAWYLWRDGRRREVLVVGAALVAAGALFLLAHRALYGGWTVYAAGDHFAETGELSVVGTSPDYAGRTRRLVGLLVDRSFGLVAWAPLYLVAVPALGALARRRPPGWEAIVAPLAAGWATATWVALTMHGWWWPGRQVVVVVPCLVLATAWAVARVSALGRLRPALVAGALLGLVLWAELVWEATTGRRTLIVDFLGTGNPVYRLVRWPLPDGLRAGVTDDVLLAVWAVVLAGLAWWGWRAASVGGDEDAGGGELADPHVPALDLHGGGPVG